jgi:proline dehydrogenase
MMRSFFLYLSGSKAARRVLLALPFSGRISRRFIAGDTLPQALDVACKLNTKGLKAALDLLGESVNSEAESRRAADEYIELLDGMDKAGVDGYASLKLTALGLDISEELALENMRRIMRRAVELKRFIRIDMENTPYTERTLKIFDHLLTEFPKDAIGTVIQSYLRRSEADMRALAAKGAHIRVVKGAYKEPPELAFPEKSDVDANYVKLMQIYFSDEARKAGAYLAVATHDPNMIAATREFVAQHGIGKHEFEFQMLYGIRNDLQEALQKEGFQVRTYIPYGSQWYPYFMRRLAERPANVWFILGNFFKG